MATAIALLFAPYTTAAQSVPGDTLDDTYRFTQDYEPSPAIWRLSDHDTTIYMLGTFHLLPEGFRWRSAQLDRIIDTADVLVVETSDADGESAMDGVSPKIIHLLEKRRPTSEQLPESLRPRWRQLVAMTQIPFDYVDSMPVMVAMLSFADGNAEGDTASYDYGIETVLEREFAETDRPVESIEDYGRIMYGLFHAEDAALVRDLEAKLGRWDGKSLEGFFGAEQPDLSGDAYWAMEHAWARGEVAEDFDLGLGDGRIGEVFREILLDRRNTQWAEWLDARLDQPGTVLLAVGAGHFEGPESVLVKLAERGLVAERVD